MKRPLVWIAIIFSLGIALGNFLRLSFVLVYILILIVFIGSLTLLKKERIFFILLFLSIFLLGIAAIKNKQVLPRCHVLKYLKYKSNDTYIIKGFIASHPIAKLSKTSFIFMTEEIQINHLKYNCCGYILVYAPKKDLSYGEELILRGKLYKPFYRSSSRQKSYRDYLYHQGIYCMMNVESASHAVRLNKNKGFLYKRFALWLKDRIEKTISSYVSPAAASILGAMILGEKRNIPAFVYNSMVKSGTVHILVVSGFNVGIVAFIIVLFLRLIRTHRKIRLYVACPLLMLYCLMTGASTPVVRATVMAIVFMFAYLVKREPDIYNSCALASLFILGMNPRQLFDVGFQLSFASVISIVFLYPKIKSLLHTEALKIKGLQYLIDSCLISLSAWLGTMGFVAYYFKIFSPVTVLANLLIVPLASLITLCGFSLVSTALVCPPLAFLFASTSELIVAILLKINSLLLKLPEAYFYFS